MFDVGIYGDVTFVPPDCKVYQPSNVYPSFVGVSSSTLFDVYVAVNCPSPSPNVYAIPLRVPFPVTIHLSKFMVCFTCFVSPLLFNVTVYPSGTVGFVTATLELYVPCIVEFAVVPLYVPPFGFTVNV